MTKPKQFDDSQALNETVGRQEMKNGWLIAHPGTGEIIKCESFDVAMRDWFEGFNMPIRVEDGVPEDYSKSIQRVREHYR